MLDFVEVEKAYERISPFIRKTPCWRSDFLSNKFEADIYLKLENFQVTGSYKERGALNRMLVLSKEQKKKGVVAASAGNHAQAIAYHAKRLGIKATIFMPRFAPLVKVLHTQQWGAHVQLVGENYDEAYDASSLFAKESGGTYVHAYNDPMVIAGQASVGLEIMQDVKDVDLVVVPVGGGGLAAGLSFALKTKAPKAKIVGVEPVSCRSMYEAYKAKGPVLLKAGATIADGIAVRRVGDLSYRLCERYLDDLCAVEDDLIAQSILLLLEEQKILAEGAGATALAFLMGLNKAKLKGQKVVLVVTGGNIDITQLSRVIERGLVASGRLMRVQLKLRDRPGSLAQVLATIGELGANVIKVHHDRAFAQTDWNEALVELVLESRGEAHKKAIVQRLKEEVHMVKVIDVPELEKGAKE